MRSGNTWRSSGPRCGQGSNAVTTEVLSDTLEGVGSFVGVEGLGGLLTFTAEVPRETADALRDPAQFAGA